MSFVLIMTELLILCIILSIRYSNQNEATFSVFKAVLQGPTSLGGLNGFQTQYKKKEFRLLNGGFFSFGGILGKLDYGRREPDMEPSCQSKS